MKAFSRIADGTTIQVLNIEPPFSNFSFHEEVPPCGFHKPGPLRRILSQVRRLGGQTMVIESLAPSVDVAEENQDLVKLHPEMLPGITRRLSFFRKKFKTEKGLGSIKPNEVLGYVILKEEFLSVDPLHFNTRVFESVLLNPHRKNNFIRGAKAWDFRCGSRMFSIKGYLYAEQNGQTNCCAHVALRCAAALFHPKGDMSYAEMNKILGIDHVTVFAWDGLSLSEQVRVLESAGAKCVPASYDAQTADLQVPSFQRMVYGTIESGWPAIVTFKTDNSAHAVPIFGHTLSQDTWVPLAECSYFEAGENTRYIPTDSWLSMFICHDDNFGSNVCMPRYYLRQIEPVPDDGIAIQASSTSNSREVLYVIGTLPKDVKIDPITAELVGAHYLWHIAKTLPAENIWNRRIKDSVSSPKNPNNNQLVLRTRLVKGEEYSEHLGKLRGWNGVDRIHSSLLGPIRQYIGNDWVWIVEFSMHEVFAGNLRKLGEIVVRADKELDFGKTDLEGFIIARFPTNFITIDLRGGNGSSTFIDSGIVDHVPLLDCC